MLREPWRLGRWRNQTEHHRQCERVAEQNECQQQQRQTAEKCGWQQSLKQVQPG